MKSSETILANINSKIFAHRLQNLYFRREQNEYRNASISCHRLSCFEVFMKRQITLNIHTNMKKRRIFENEFRYI